MPIYLKEDSAISSFKQLIDMAGKYSSNLSKIKSTNYLNKSSIARASKDLIMSFPVLCSDTIDATTAMMICKAVERNSVTMLQLVLTSANLTGENGIAILKQWHTNIDSNMSLDDYINSVGALTKDGEDVRFNRIGEAGVIAQAGKFYKTQFLGSINVKYPEESLSEHSIGDYISSNKYGRLDVFVMSESKNDKSTTVPEKKEETNKTIMTPVSSEKDNKDKEEYSLNYKDIKERELKDNTDFFTKQLLDSDVKKANELIPSLMIIRFNVGDPNEAKDTSDRKIPFEVKEFIAGVKARLISVPSEEIIARVVANDRDRIDMKNLIRATTKEISFTKDFVMGIGQAKIDAKNNSKLSATNPIWRALQARSAKSSLKRLFKTANTGAAITTLVVSQAEVNYIKNTYDVDLDNPVVARDFMEAYNLIALVIADEQAEIAKFLYDGDDYYQMMTFGSLERETGDGSYKKVINLISKINRG